jgi:hypothetical protein
MTDQQYDDPFADSGQEKSPALSFPTVGTAYTGTVTDPPKLVQQRVYKPTGDGPPAFWDKEETQPKMAVVINLTVDDERRSLWAPKPSALFRVIGDAQREAGARIQPGGTLHVKFTHEAPSPNGFLQKQYAVKYKPGTPAAADPWADTSPLERAQHNVPVTADSAPPF